VQNCIPARPCPAFECGASAGSPPAHRAKAQLTRQAGLKVVQACQTFRISVFFPYFAFVSVYVRKFDSPSIFSVFLVFSVFVCFSPFKMKLFLKKIASKVLCVYVIGDDAVLMVPSVD